MGKGFNHQKAAMVLCDAVILGDRRAAQKWDISQRSIQRYRKKLENSDKLRQLTTEYHQLQTEKWIEDLSIGLSAVLQFIQQAALSLEPNRAENLTVMTKALEVLFDMELSQKVIRARLGK